MSKSFINYNTHEGINRYFKEVKQGQSLTQEKEKELSIRIKEGDIEAVNELVKVNLPFVVTIAKEYIGQGVPLADLINEGNYGLIKAAYKFDHNYGYKFISYAVWWIRQSILQSLNEHSRIIRIPTNLINKLAQLKKDINLFEMVNEREATFSDELNANGDKLRTVASSSLTLNDRVNEDGDELHELIEDDLFKVDDNYYSITDDVKSELDKTLSILTPREREIIECYFGIDKNIDPMTLEAIGEKFNISRERVRQIKRSAIRKLRHNAHGLYELLG
jgi:RNA polymerase primary sigma factor